MRHRRGTTLALVVAVVAATAAMAVRVPERAEASGGIGFGTPVKMPNSPNALYGGASEPSIALDSDGTIYVTAACCLPVAAAAWYSKDGGETFQVLPSPGGARESTIGAEGDYVVDDADRVILADTRVPSIVVTRWTDNGDTWERSVDASEVTVPLQDRPWLAWGQGALYLYVNGGIQNTYVYESFDEGLTWNPVPTGSFNGNFPTMLTANRQDGAIWLVGRNGFTDPVIVSDVSTDGGETWTHSHVADASRGAVSPTTGLSVATDEAGNGYAVWSTWDDNGCDIEMAVSTDHGATWQGPVKVNESTSGCATFPWVDAGAPGRAVVTWFQNDVSKPQSQMPGPSTWHVHAAVSTDALSAAPTFAEARLPDVIADRGNLTTGYGQNGSATRSLLDFFEVAAGPDGRFHVSYAENTTQGRANTWYVGQGAGPLLHANRIADATEVVVDRADVADGALSVAGSATFKRAPVARLFEPLAVDTPVGGEVTRVGPDSDELLATMLIPPTGAPAYDNLPGDYVWGFDVGDESHLLEVLTTPAGNQFLLDGERIGGTVDAREGKAVARLSLSAVGAAPGDEIRFLEPVPARAVSGPFDEAAFTVPEATVTLSLQQDGTEVAGTAAMLDDIATGYTGTLDVSTLPAGTYDLVVTGCYAGDCGSTTTPVTI